MGEIMALRKDMGKKFLKHGFSDFKWINPERIVVSYWVRMKCIFGCSEYGKSAACPPNTPSVSECERFFREYKEAVIFHFEKKVDKPEDRHTWTKDVNANLLKLERAVFLSGYEKAFILFMDTCQSCQNCTGTRETCNEPKLSRPAPDSMAVDVYTTVRQVGYPIEVLKDYSETMNRYAFLMVE